jgi:cell division inhibitor SulA
MGSEISCECLTEAFSSATGGLTSLASQQIQASKLEQLKRETKFNKKVLMGMTTQDIFLRLSEDTSTIVWRCPPTSVSSTWAAVSGASAEQFGELSLVENVATVRSVAPNGFAVVDFSNKLACSCATRGWRH